MKQISASTHLLGSKTIIIIIIFIQEFGTLLHKIKHETIKIKHNT